MNRLLIVGGSGVLGSAVVNQVRKTQTDFLLASRTRVKVDPYSPVHPAPDGPWRRVDLLTGEGLRQALAGVDTVIHLASAPGKLGREFREVVMMRTLLQAVKQSAVKHLVYSSIVGIDRVPFSYYQAKLASEHLLRQSGLPYSILRATQFHEFVDFTLSSLLRYPVGLVPESFRIQPIAVDAVAQELLRLTDGEGGQALTNLGGPHIYDGRRLAHLWLQHRRLCKAILPIPSVGSTMKRITEGGLTCPEFASPSQSWEAYLAANGQWEKNKTDP